MLCGASRRYGRQARTDGHTSLELWGYHLAVVGAVFTLQNYSDLSVGGDFKI